MIAEIDWNPATIAIAGAMAVPILVTAFYYWYRVEKVRSDNQLKRSMLERGMSTEEIERVLAAGAEKE